MNKLIVAAMVLLLGSYPALAQSAAGEKTGKTTAKPAATAKKVSDKKLSPQQSKMKLCNAQAAEKQVKGDQRKAFMKDCLSAKK